MVTGRKPKPDGQKVNRVPLLHEWIDVPDVPFTGERPALGFRAGIATRTWWESVSTMPHCVLWRPGDWQVALATARLHANFSRTGRFGSELRIRERAMGVTEEGRVNLRIRYVAVDEPRAADDDATPISDFAAARRRRIVEGVGGTIEE